MAILLNLANQYRENPSWFLLKRIQLIFVKAIKKKFSLWSDSEIKEAVLKVFEEYKGEKVFYIELVRTLKKEK